MTQSIALDDFPVPKNANSQETGEEKQEREKHRHEKNINQLPPTGTTIRDRICNLSWDKYKTLVIGLLVLILLVLIIICVYTANKVHQSIQCCCCQCCCPDGWIGFQDYCYYFSDDEKNWTSSRNHCIAEHADLAVIDTTHMMDFLRQHKHTSDHWIGLKMKENQMGKWVNGAIFNQLFKVSGNETCAYLGDDGVATARCYTGRKFICRKKKH
ncbi:C-type lectin domain family 2 member B [Sturnira hondurensis]|uniref:C-type lectin domain family 2 member B n=1 Tax=Sturnira hondurensis TaxID=192404 RepID=UPI00187A1492|nr:C-type lectin domain family 2 member B [Sturnira hondurensis]